MSELYELAEFTDIETGRIEALLKPGGGLWIPPKVVLESGMLTYSCGGLEHLVLTGDLLFSLYDHGWRTAAEPDATSLLGGFLKLGDAKDEHVREFAERWGPIWVCAEHQDCVCSPIVFKPHPDCTWRSREPVNEFRRRSRQVKAALDIGASLNVGKKTTEAQWGDLLGKPHYPPDGVQRILLTTVVNKRLRAAYGPFLELRWYEKSAELGLNPGFGFLPLVWMQVAQVVSGSKSICRCDGCGNYYVRHRRKPALNRHNFCEACAVADHLKTYFCEHSPVGPA